MSILKNILKKQVPINTNITDVELILNEIKTCIKEENKIVANSLFDIILDKTFQLKNKPFVVGEVAEIAEELGHKIKAAQLYEVAGSTFNSNSTYFLNKSLILYDENGEVNDTQRIEKKLKLYSGVPKRE
ncbi:MAG: hypothetical protein QXL94_03310 [Candidatus Parvarchaeum sp.]